MRYRTIGTDPARRRDVSVISLGAMLFGTVTDEPTAFAILDRFVEAGGTFIDTSNNYAFWVNDTQGGESEALVGRWRRSRGIGAEIVIATKLGARPREAGTSYIDNAEGLSAEVIRASSAASRERLGLSTIDILYAHIDDLHTPQQETVEALAALVTDGTLGMLGVSNQWAWRIERARGIASAAGLPGYELLQYSYSYLQPRTDGPVDLSPDGDIGVAGGDLLSYVRADPGLTLVAYSPLLGGRYAREDRPLQPRYDHPGTTARLAALREVAHETGATPNQVVLSWLMGGAIPVLPLVGASSVAQIEESLAAVDLDLTPDQRHRLDSAG